MLHKLSMLLPLVALLVAPYLLRADEPEFEPIDIPTLEREEPVDFESEILPLLSKNCLACHSAAVADSGLVLETPKSILEGGYSGPAVDPESPDDSMLLLVASGQSEPYMPPPGNKAGAKPFTPEELALIRLWIQQGAQGEVRGRTAVEWQPLPPGVNPIYAVTMTRDGQFIPCGRANQIFIYHVPTGQTICRLTDPNLIEAGLYDKPGVAHRDIVQSLAISPDGYTLASGGYRTVKLWRRPQNARLLELAITDKPLTTAAVSADGAWIAAADEDNRIHLRKLTGGDDAARTIEGHAARVSSLRFDSESARLVSASIDGSVRVWNVPDGMLVARLDTPAAVHDVVLKADGSGLLTAGADHAIRLWDWPTAPRMLASALENITLVQVAAAGDHLAVARSDGKIAILDRASGEQKALFDAQGSTAALGWSGNGKRLARANGDGQVEVYDAESAGHLASYPNVASAHALNADGTELIAGTPDGRVVAWHVTAASDQRLAPQGDAPARIAVTSRDGKLLATDTMIDGATAILVRDAASGEVRHTLSGHQAAIESLAFNIDATRLASAASDGTARVWNLADGTELAKFAGHGGAATSVALAGDHAISGGADGSVTQWNAADGSAVRRFDGHTAAIVGLAVTADGGTLVSASADGTVRLWNMADGAQQHAIEVGTPLVALTVSPDGARIAALGTDHQVRLYSRQGEALATYQGPISPARSLFFTTDGARLVLATADRQVQVLAGSNLAPLETLHARADLAFVAPAGDAGRLLVGHTDRSIDVAHARASRLLEPAGQPIVAIVRSQDGSALYTARQDGTVTSHAIGDGSTRYRVALGGEPIALATSSDNQWLAAAMKDGTVKLLAAADGAAVEHGVLSGIEGLNGPLAFTADGKHLAVSAGQRVLLYDVANGSQVQAFAGGGSPIVGLAAGSEPSDVVVADHAGVRVESRRHVGRLNGHEGPVTSLALLPNGSSLVSGSEDGTLRQWDLSNLQETRKLEQGGPVTAVAVRADGKRIASAGANHVVRLWNAEDGAQVAEWKGDYQANGLVARRTADVGRLKAAVDAATAGQKGAEEDLAARTKAHEEAVAALAAAQKTSAEAAEAAKTAAAKKDEADKLVASTAAAAKMAEEAKPVADEKAAKAAELAEAANQAVADAKGAADLHAQASAAAKTAAAAVNAALEKSPDDEQLAEAKKNAEQAAADAARAEAASKAFLAVAEGVAAERNTALQEANAAREAAEKAVADTAAAAKAAVEAQAAAEKAKTEADEAAKKAADALASAEKSVASAERAVTTATARLETAKSTLAELTAEHEAATVRLSEAQAAAAEWEQPPRSLHFAPDNIHLAVGGDDATIRAYQAESGTAMDTFRGHTGPVVAVSYTPHGSLVSAAADGSVKVWQLYGEWTLAGQLGPSEEAPLDVSDSPLTDRVVALAFHPDGKLLATGGGEPSRSGELQLWDLETGKLVRNFEDAHSDTVFGVTFSPDGKYLASSGADKFVKVFEVDTGEFVKAFEGHTHHALGVAWSDDGKLLASCGADEVIKVWNFETGEQQRTIGGFGKQVTSITFVGNTQTTLTASGDKTVRLHTVGDGKNIRNFGGGTDFMNSAVVTPDGRLVVAGGQDSVLRVWDGNDGKALLTFEPPAAESTEQARR